MTQDEIIDMAKQAGASPDGKLWLMYAEEFEVFAKLIAEAEREACAKFVDHILKEGNGTWGDAIRARGQA